MTDKELEKLFRQKLSQQEFLFNPGAWEAMRSQLDRKTSPAAGAFYWRSVAAILAFGIIIGGLTTWLPPQKHFFNQAGVQQQWTVERPLGQAGTRESETGHEVSTTGKKDVTVFEETLPAQREVATGKSTHTATTAGIAASSSPDKTTSFGASRLENSPASSKLNSSSTVELVAIPPKDLPPKSFSDSKDFRSASASQGLNGFTPDVLKRYQQKQQVELVAGSLLSDAHHQNEAGIGWHAGISYQHRISPHWLIESGLSYAVMNNVGLQTRSDSIFYHFGSEKIETEISSQQLEYIELPLHLGWQPHPRYKLQLGAYAGYLLSVTQQKVKKHYWLSEMVDHQQEEVSGENENFNRLDLGLSAGYFYQLTPDFSFGIQLRKGFRDITRNINSTYEKEHYNLNTRISLRYRIL